MQLRAVVSGRWTRPRALVGLASLACVGASGVLAALPAHADDRGSTNGAFALVLDGAESGLVRSIPAVRDGKKAILISTEQPSAPLLGTVRAFLDGKASKKNLVLSTPAVIQKANDARLVDVRLPSYAGGANDLALTFEVASTSSSPSLRAASDKAKPAGLKLAGFRLSIGDLPTSEATRLDSVAVKNREGASVPSSFTFDVPSRDAPAYLAWAKKAAPRDGSIEYVSMAGEPILAVKIAGCTASSARIDGPVTHVVVQCTRARAT